MIDYDKLGHCVKCHKKIADYLPDGRIEWHENAKDHTFILNNFSNLPTKICQSCLDNLSQDDYEPIMDSVVKGWEKEFEKYVHTAIERNNYFIAAKKLRIVANHSDLALIAGGATITLPNTFTAGTTIQSSQVNSNFTTIYNDYNGNITNANIASGAAIAASKLNLATIAQVIAMSGQPINFAQGTNIASASTTNIGAATGNYVVITGTTTITAFDTVQAGTIRWVEFSGALTLTHNSTSLILPGAANITTTAGDTAVFVSEGSGNWRCLNYTYGTTLVLPGGNFPIEGYSTGKSVLRKINLTIAAGGTPGTNINITNNGSNVSYNAPTISNATNMGKGASSGSFSLNAAGNQITLDLTQNVVGIISFSLSNHVVKNASTTAGDIYFPRVLVSSGNFLIRFAKTAADAEVDMTGVFTTAGDNIVLELAFITST